MSRQTARSSSQFRIIRCNAIEAAAIERSRHSVLSQLESDRTIGERLIHDFFCREFGLGVVNEIEYARMENTLLQQFNQRLVFSFRAVGRHNLLHEPDKLISGHANLLRICLDGLFYPM
ncbi:hypothetical protein VR41_08040 [Streptomyces sp. NRRL B-1568]|nr:hypothetical protein VR41_08040 [Streptomyces sp. NRRL B-1568]